MVGYDLGEMERDSVISHGGAMNLKERLFYQSDPYEADVCHTCGFMGYSRGLTFTCRKCRTVLSTSDCDQVNDFLSILTFKVLLCFSSLSIDLFYRYKSHMPSNYSLKNSCRWELGLVCVLETMPDQVNVLTVNIYSYLLYSSSDLIGHTSCATGTNLEMEISDGISSSSSIYDQVDWRDMSSVEARVLRGCRLFNPHGGVEST